MPSHAARPSFAKEATKRPEISIHSSSLTSTSPRDRFPPDVPGDQEEERSNEANGKKHQTSHRKENVKNPRPPSFPQVSLKLRDDPSRFVTLRTYRVLSTRDERRERRRDTERSSLRLRSNGDDARDRRGGTPQWRKRCGRGTLAGQSGRMEFEKRSSAEVAPTRP